MRSLAMVAKRPRCVVEPRSVWRADWSSCEAASGVRDGCGGRETVVTRDAGLHDSMRESQARGLAFGVCLWTSAEC